MSTRPRAEPLPLEADLVQYQAARLQTAAELLEEILAEAFTDHKEANLVFRDALVLFLQDVSGQLESAARDAMKGTKVRELRRPVAGVEKEPTL